MPKKPPYPCLLKKCSHQSTRSSSSTMGKVRIIGGDWRGRKLPILVIEGLRPTSGRVRETVFNWLQFEVSGAICLDVFSGSGALGLEALSRGAKVVTFLELSVPVVKQLKTNLNDLSATDKGQVIQCDSLQWLDRLANQESSTAYDIIFLDPPFEQCLMQTVVDKLFTCGKVVNHRTWLYLEQEKKYNWPRLPQGWVCHREKSTSQVRFGLFYFVG